MAEAYVAERVVEVREQVDPYALAARIFRALTDDGWDRDEAAETMDWLLGQGRTASQKVEALKRFAEKNDIRTNGGGK